MSTSKILQADIAPFGLRLQASLKQRVADAAERNNRSLNAEIVATLEEKYPAPHPNQDLADFVAAWMIPLDKATTPQLRQEVSREANEWAIHKGMDVTLEIVEGEPDQNPAGLLTRNGQVEMILTLWKTQKSDQTIPTLQSDTKHLADRVDPEQSSTKDFERLAQSDKSIAQAALESYMKVYRRMLKALDEENDANRRAMIVGDINKQFATHLPNMTAWLDPKTGDLHVSAGRKTLTRHIKSAAHSSSQKGKSRAR